MNAAINLLKLAWIQLTRHRVRSLLTIFGVASGMFLFTAVETLQRSLGKATEASAADTTLVVYRENRFCPSASRLPEHYADEIRRIIESSSPIVHKPLPVDDPKVRQPDITRARAILGWEPHVQFDEGIRLTIEFFRNKMSQ